MTPTQSEYSIRKKPENLPSIYLPIPQALSTLLETTELTHVQMRALQDFLKLPFNADVNETLELVDRTLDLFEDALPSEDTAFQRAQKFDIYDEFFNVGRATEHTGQTFIYGLLCTYANVLKDMSQTEHQMTVIEVPLLRVAVESTLQLFDLGEPA